MNVLGIDVGTGGTRALILDECGRVVASATQEHEPFASPHTGWAEQDPADWWSACGIAVSRVLANAQVAADQIACVGFSGQMHGAVLLDAEGRVLRAAPIWCDQRTGKQSRGPDSKHRRRPHHRSPLQRTPDQFHTNEAPLGARA